MPEKILKSWSEINPLIVKGPEGYRQISLDEESDFIDEMIEEEKYEIKRDLFKPLKQNPSQIYNKIGTDFMTNQPKYKLKD